MPEQSYSSHAKIVSLYHYVLGSLILLVLVGSLVNLYESLGDHARLYSASLITAIAVAMLLLFFFARTFPLKAQDRAIRAEENLRHFVLTGQLLDPRLSMPQIVGLRFASDAEFPELARRAASGGMSLDEVKKSVKNWRPDHDRL
jgi:hypothetical protein